MNFLSLDLSNGSLLYYLLIGSFIVWIFAVSSVSIVEITDPFYIIMKLPIYYWVALFIVISIFLLRYKFNIPYFHHMDYLFIILLSLYLYGTFSLIIENPRFMDVYLHGGVSLGIVKQGSIEISKYTREFPLSFIWFAIFRSIIPLHEFILLKIMHIFFPIVYGIILYEICKYLKVNYKYYLLLPISFLGLFFIDQGHYSPQAIALTFLLLVILLLYRSLKDQRHNLVITIITILMILFIFSINITNLTTAIALNIILSIYLLGRYLFPYKKLILYFGYRFIPRNYVWITMILSLIITTAWIGYHAKLTQNEIIYRLSDLYTNISTLTDLSLKTGVHQLYFYFNLFQYIIGLNVIISGLFFIYIFIRKRVLYNELILALLIFIVFLSILPLTLFKLGEDSTTFLQRTYMYLLIGWSIMNTIILSNINRRFLQYYIITLLVSSIMLLPIIRYGGDFANYVPSSLLYIADLITQNSYSVIITSSFSMEHPFIYTSVINDTYRNIALTSLKYYRYETENINFRINHLLVRETKTVQPDHIYVIISERDINKYLLVRNDPYFIDHIETELHYNNLANKISDNIYNKAYYYIMKFR